MEFLNNRKDLKILDAGCGNGSIANSLIRMGYQVTGVDMSKSGIESANKINPGHFYFCDFEKNDLPEDLPIKEFDIIISTKVIEHLYSPNAFIQFCMKALKMNGEMLISTHNMDTLKT